MVEKKCLHVYNNALLNQIVAEMRANYDQIIHPHFLVVTHCLICQILPPSSLLTPIFPVDKRIPLDLSC